jgi:hypothetical protein
MLNAREILVLQNANNMDNQMLNQDMPLFIYLSSFHADLNT